MVLLYMKGRDMIWRGSLGRSLIMCSTINEASDRSTVSKFVTAMAGKTRYWDNINFRTMD